MIRLTNVPDAARYPLKPELRRVPRFIGYGGVDPRLSRDFDPAFLRYEGDSPVYCTDICVEVLQHKTAGLSELDALCDLYLMIDEKPEGVRPLTD